MNLLEVKELGLLSYDKAYLLQKELLEKKKKIVKEKDYLLFVEHPNVYTFGRKSNAGIPNLENFVFIERGGEATFHNPGQLVCYPILYLQEKERDIHQYLRKLEGVIMNMLAAFHIKGERKEGATGVWVKNQEKKIASIGIAISSWVSYHGVAINVNNDLSGFNQINPCGFSSSVMTSIEKELGNAQTPNMEAVKEVFLKSFCAEFERELG